MARAFTLFFLCFISVCSFSQIVDNNNSVSVAKRPALYSADTAFAFDTVIFPSEDTIVYNAISKLAYFEGVDTLTIIDDAIYTLTDTLNLYLLPHPIEFAKYLVVNSDSVYLIKKEIIRFADSVYVFNIPENSNLDSVAALKVNDPYAGTWKYKWFKFDTTQPGAWLSLANDTLNNIDSLSDGGYKVELSGPQDTSFIAWVKNNDMYMSFDTMKDVLDTIDIVSYTTCSRITFRGEYLLDSFYYFDPSSSPYERILLTDSIRIQITWTCAENPYSYDACGLKELSPKYNSTFFTTEPNPLNTTYYVDGSDNFGCKRYDTLFYKSVIPKASFKPVYRDSDDETWSEDGSPKGSAPVSVLFINESLNYDKKIWYYDDVPRYPQDESLLKDPQTYDYETYYIYYIPGEYAPGLYLQNDFFECRDSMTLETPIVVDPSKIDVPNFFTPNEDGSNDVFIIDFASLKLFKVEIFNEWGHTVYEYEGDVNDWEGWNGKIKNSDRDAPNGQYYYVISGLGWEYSPEVEYKPEKFTGTVHLYR